jgi:hypothetical protein
MPPWSLASRLGELGRHVSAATGVRTLSVRTAGGARPAPVLARVLHAIACRQRGLAAGLVCSLNPMVMTSRRDHAAGMNESQLSILESARALLSAAEQLEREFGSLEAAPTFAPALAHVEPALRALGRACELASRTIIPSPDPYESPSARLARAAAAWPGATVPSHEALVRILSSLHDAAAALRFAETTTSCAREVLASKLPAAPRMQTAA